MRGDILVLTTEEVPGRRVVKGLGLVRGSAVLAGSFGRDIITLLRHIVGGEVPEYTRPMAQAREQALGRMKEEAAKLGANAVVGVRFSTAMIMTGAAEMLAYGTAVVVE